jgi:hypothetical protein
MPYTPPSNEYDAASPSTPDTSANTATAKTPGWGAGLFGMFSTTKKAKPVAAAVPTPGGGPTPAESLFWT